MGTETTYPQSLLSRILTESWTSDLLIASPTPNPLSHHATPIWIGATNTKEPAWFRNLSGYRHERRRRPSRAARATRKTLHVYFFIVIQTSKVHVVSDNAARWRVSESHTAGVVHVGGVRTSVDRLTRVLYVHRVRSYVGRLELDSMPTANLVQTRR